MKLGPALSPAVANAGPAIVPGPIILVAPALSGQPDVGAGLTLDPGSWSGAGAVTLAYQWTRGGAILPGETATTYTVAEADAGQGIGCLVIGTDSNGTRSFAAGPLAITPGWDLAPEPGAIRILSMPPVSAPAALTAVQQITITG